MNNLSKLQSLLSEELPAILLTSAPNRQYASGALIDEGMCLVTARGCRYFTDGRYIETAQKQLPDVLVQEIDRENTYYQCIQAALCEENIKSLGIEEEDLTHGAYLRLQKNLSAELIPCQRMIDAFRAVKDPWEQDIMRRAQEITDGVFTELLGVIAPGMREKELEAELIYRAYRAGAEGLSFPPIVVSGPNTSMPHGVAGERRLQSGDFITMDFGIVLGGYCSDMTRTVALGSVSPEMREVYDTVLRAQLAGIAATCAGRTGAEIDGAAREVISAAGYGPYFCHSYGHSLGLEIHESPNCSPSNDKPIPAGAVISAEPGIYLPGEFGVRIEDVIIVTQDGAQDITRSTKELIIL